ncbi:hypothetical protein [Parasalinivibrio latis]|uniref:sensor histidine kinase n=1 Tax=Parasalinivibrio latis TaxID=2952610 RepID=UPI003DA35667
MGVVNGRDGVKAGSGRVVGCCTGGPGHRAQFGCFFFPPSFSIPAGAVEINRLHATANPSDFPSELDGLPWQPASLPDDWYQSGKTSDSYWYRFVLSGTSGNGLDRDRNVALYFPMASENLTVYLNGIWLGQSGTDGPVLGRSHNIPQFFVFAPERLNPGENTFLFRVRAETPAQGLLDRVYLGNVPDLQPVYEWKFFSRVSVVKWLTGVMLLMSPILAGFWLYRQRDAAYGIFSLVLLFWGLHNLNLIVVEIPVSGKVWETFTILTLGWTVSAVIWFDHRFLNVTRPAVEKALLLHSLAGLMLFLTPDYPSLLFWGYGIWYQFLVLFGLYATVFLFSVFLGQGSWDAYLMLLVGAVIVVCGVHDILLVNHFWPRFDGFVIQYSALPTVVLFTWFLIRRFIRALNTAEELTRSLERQVYEKQQAIEAQYSRLYRLEKEQVLSEERERMMRDMHDGFGGSLVSLAALLQKQQGEVFVRAHGKVQECITDLRLVIDSLDPMLGDLNTLLATVRVRMLGQLESAGVELEWDVTELPEGTSFSPQRNLHIMRILQEAMTNSIKHSGSRKLRLSSRAEKDGTVKITVRDFGTAGILSFDSGRGIENMRWRAGQLGGKLVFTENGEGISVRLVLPAP